MEIIHEEDDWDIPSWFKLKSKPSSFDDPDIVLEREMESSRKQQEQGHALGYTIAQRRLKEARFALATHRRSRKEWRGNQEGYRDKERRYVTVVRYYQELLREPDYRASIRAAHNRKRRVKPRRARKVVIVKPIPPRDPDAPWWVNANRRARRDEYEGHLAWMIYRIKKKRFKTREHLAGHYGKGLRWVDEALSNAVTNGWITEEELKDCFRKRGRPRTGTKRGPYRKQSAKRIQGISVKLLISLRNTVRPEL